MSPTAVRCAGARRIAAKRRRRPQASNECTSHRRSRQQAPTLQPNEWTTHTSPWPWPTSARRKKPRRPSSSQPPLAAHNAAPDETLARHRHGFVVDLGAWRSPISLEGGTLGRHPATWTRRTPNADDSPIELRILAYVELDSANRRPTKSPSPNGANKTSTSTPEPRAWAGGIWGRAVTRAVWGDA